MLHGRDVVLERIEELGRGARDEALLLIGDVGSGKTSLLAEQAHRDPALYSLVRVNRSESSWPLSGVASLLSAVGDPRVAGFAGRFELRTDGPGRHADAAGELLAMLRGLALRPTVLLVDDIDRMDLASRRIVGHMAGHLAGSGLRIVATAADLSSDEPLAGLPRIELGPLDDAALAELAPAGIDPGTQRILAAQASGNLGAFSELVASLTPEQLDGRDALRLPPIPGPAAWAARERASRNLGRTRSAVLDRLATAPLHDRASIAAWGPDADDALQELVDVGLAREHGLFVLLPNPLLRAALASALPAQARRAVHAELATAAGPLVRPWHAACADPTADHRLELLDAADELTRLGHPLVAVEYADRAIRFDREGLAGALARLAERLLLNGTLDLAERYLRIAATDPRPAADDALLLAVMRLHADRLSGRRTDPPHLEAEIIAGASDEARERWMGAAEAVLAARGESPASVASSDAGPAADPLLLALQARGAALAQDYPRARTLVARLDGSLVRPNPAWSGWLASLAVDCEVRAGRIGAALELARDWQSHASATALPPGVAPLHTWARLAANDLDAAVELLLTWTDNAVMRVGPLEAASALALLGDLTMLQGDPERAADHLLLAGAIAAPLDDPALTRHLPALAESLMATGRTLAARQAADRLADAARRHPSRWTALATDHARIAVAEPELLPVLVAQALEHHGADDAGFDLGRLLATAARRLAMHGAIAESAVAATEARIALTGAGALPWARRVTPVPVASAPLALEAPSPGRTAYHALSAEERAVVDLVVQGYHNKDIAARLFISVRTVELRLTHVYRTVGARSRAHLVALMS